MSNDNVGGVLEAQGDLPGALKNYRDSLAIAEKLAAQDPGNAGWQTDLAWSYKQIGSVHSAEKNFDAALPIYRKARDIYESLSKNLPEFGKRYQGNLVEVYGNISWCTLFTRQPEEAIQAAARGTELDPNQHWIKTNLAHGYLFTNQFEKAKAIYTQNRELDLGDDKTFAKVVLDDFLEFRERGLKHPRMVEIERLLSTKP